MVLSAACEARIQTAAFDMNCHAVIRYGMPASIAAIEEVETALGTTMPNGLRELYLEIARSRRSARAFPSTLRPPPLGHGDDVFRAFFDMIRMSGHEEYTPERASQLIPFVDTTMGRFCTLLDLAQRAPDENVPVVWVSEAELRPEPRKPVAASARECISGCLGNFARGLEPMFWRGDEVIDLTGL